MENNTNLKVTMKVLTLILLSVFAYSELTGLSECGSGRSTYFEYNDNGACGYGPIVRGGSFGSIGYAALNEEMYNNAAQCGVCYEIVGPKGVLYVRIVDECPANEANPGCHGQYVAFDIGEEGFSTIGDKAVGGANITYRMVACEISTNLIIMTPSGISPTFYAFVVKDHTIGVSQAEISSDNKTFFNCQRQAWNTWNYTPQTPLVAPLYIKVTSIAGDVVYAKISDIAENKEYLADANFKVPTDLVFDTKTLIHSQKTESTDMKCCSVPDEYSILYDDGLLGTWYENSYSINSINMVYNTNCYQGKCIEANIQQYGALQIVGSYSVPKDQFSSLQFYVKSSSCEKCLLVSCGGTKNSAVSIMQSNVWQQVQIPFTAMGCSDIKNFAFQNNNLDTIFYFDSISLLQNPNAPSLERCFTLQPQDPSQSDGNQNPISSLLILSIFSLFLL
ncbi:hypothetical protein EIN_059020 [Entamoeba invadens IP1]|uniref:hypothetical protein n=1 Tax=Entamoeba invadens IP1 TaxID=370355 RepID=UPI0002C3E45B|nr:hypothetical protein EIN_059020 [Entamoeba invadens IP1]ELP93437.1 hypothetical protein EIN_059020 [Entamoeba invadens IP1]|eukprot:XP_004260208.1 hypothetical protein EIN_059020 [Entamoeba invadens IP1]